MCDKEKYKNEIYSTKILTKSLSNIKKSFKM